MTLVERFPPAVTDAGSNLEAFDNIDLIEGRVEEVLPELETPVDAALVDPPREGLSAEAVEALAACGAGRLLYLSGDAASLARDARRLRPGVDWRLRQGAARGSGAADLAHSHCGPAGAQQGLSCHALHTAWIIPMRTGVPGRGSKPSALQSLSSVTTKASKGPKL